MATNKKHLDNFYKEKYSLRDYKMLEKYFRDKNSNEETMQQMHEQWNDFRANKELNTNLDHVFSGLLASINASGTVTPKIIQLFYRLKYVAAILVAAIIISSAIYFVQRNAPVAQSTFIEFASNTGDRSYFKLPDGTSGWLGAESSLKYRMSDDNQREVYLDGRAFFDVFHNSKQPFVVKTPANLDVQVLGTRFGVTAYQQENSCEVVLEKGKVLLSNQNGLHKEMIPSERVVYHPANNKLESVMIDPSDYLSWIDGLLVMKDISLKEATEKLSRFYNVTFDFKTKNIENERIRLVIENESLEECLNLLSKIASVKFVVEERTALTDHRFSKKNIIVLNN